MIYLYFLLLNFLILLIYFLFLLINLVLLGALLLLDEKEEMAQQINYFPDQKLED